MIMIHSFYSTTTKLSRKDPISSYSTKKEIQNLAQHLMSRLFDCNDTKEDGSNSSSSTINEMSLDMCIEKATEKSFKRELQGKSVYLLKVKRIKSQCHQKSTALKVNALKCQPH